MFDDLYYIYHSLSSYILRLNLQLRNKEPGMVACSRSEHGSIIVENLNKNGQMLVEVIPPPPPKKKKKKPSICIYGLKF